jgi:SAM-dependent methyltransferase
MNWKVRKRYAIAFLQDWRQFTRRPMPRTCTICGYHGVFTSVARPPRWNARCPNCDSRERHRLAMLLYRELGLFEQPGLSVLHFAPEAFMASLMAGHAGYVTTDPKMSAVSRREDIRAISGPDESYDIVIAHHVLEHIDDDAKAVAEVFRVLKPGGRFIVSVPINWSREHSFEDARFRTRSERAAAFSGTDHLRMYGRDFPRRLEAAGFAVREYRADPVAEVIHALGREEAIYVATRPAAGVSGS